MLGNSRTAPRAGRQAAVSALVGLFAFALLGCGSDSSSTGSEPEQSSIAPTSTEAGGQGPEALIEEAKAKSTASVEEAKEMASQTVEKAEENASLSKSELQTIKAEAKEALLATKEHAKEALEAARTRAAELKE